MKRKLRLSKRHPPRYSPAEWLRILRIVCRDCGQPAMPGFARCERHHKRSRERDRVRKGYRGGRTKPPRYRDNPGIVGHIPGVVESVAVRLNGRVKRMYPGARIVARRDGSLGLLRNGRLVADIVPTHGRTLWTRLPG